MRTGPCVRETLDWNVAVYCLNEAARLEGCLASIASAMGDRRYLITAIFNGTTDRGIAIAQEAAHRMPIEIFSIATPDKANAINRFFHELRKPARLYAGIDGYVHLGPNAFEALETRLEEAPHAHAMSGSAVTGRSMLRYTAETLAEGGRLHGQFHALRPEFVDAIVARGIKLPIGLYFGDGLLNSMSAHSLDPMHAPWDKLRSQGAAGATYALPLLSPFRLDDLKRQFRRRVRQQRGRIQSEAIKQVIYTAGYEALPEDSHVMELDYLARHGLPPASLLDRPFQWLALRQIREQAARVDPDFAPRRIGSPS
jgi:hypothetical protein